MDLERLIASEERNEARVAAARAEAAALVADAERAAEAREAALQAATAAGIREAEGRLAAEGQHRIAEIITAGTAAAARFDAMDDDQIRALAHRLVDRLLPAEVP